MTTNKIDLKNLSFEQLQSLVHELGMELYRAKQIARWVFHKHAADIDHMTDLPRDLRSLLSGCACISSFAPAQQQVSRDGSIKYQFLTEDSLGVETVYIPERKHITLCVSTQVGCAMGCRFCCTGAMGLVRNLTAAEILNQISAVLQRKDCLGKLPNIVFMGMGEPLSNYENTVKSIRILLSPWCYDFSHRKITVSTAGVVPGIDRLGQELPVNLAVSLNAPNDALRNYLMPVNRRFPLDMLMDAVRRYPVPPRKRITFEYILIKDINDSEKHAAQLSRLLADIPCKINLIPYNAHTATGFKQPEEQTISRFQDMLHARHFTAPVRRSKGADIAAACGQLGGPKAGAPV